MSTRLTLSLLVALSAAAAAQAPQLKISIGVRETGIAGSPFTNIGDNGGTLGGIEWIDKDTQVLTLDGTWQFFSFSLATHPITAFAGTTANGVIDGQWGTLEHIRVLNDQGITTPINLWIDDVQNTVTPTGGGPTTTTFGTFEGYADNAEVMFQEPGFSGSTAGNLVVTPPGTSGVDNLVASRTSSDRCKFQFLDATPTRWVRLTSFNTLNQRNPLVRFDDNSVIGFWMRGGVPQPSLGSQGPGTAIAEMVGDGLNVGQNSTFWIGRATPNVPGVILVSFAGLPDVPIFGGNLVSFAGFILGVAVPSDNDGHASLAFPGFASVFDLAIQGAYVDFLQPDFFSFSNAVNAQFGR